MALGFLTSLQAQEPVTVSTAAGNADQVWYSLSEGEVGRAPLNEWDLAFEMTGVTAGIRVNTAKGITVYETTYTPDEWGELLAPDVDTWTEINNEVTRWDIGALNHGNDMDVPSGVNVGWGMYNSVTHHMTGNKVYALQMPDEAWVKLRINSMANGTFSFTYANIDGSDSHDGAVNKTAFLGKNFAYWSFNTHTSLDREPANDTWDLLFTKYTDFVPIPYPVAGVLQNRRVSAQQVDGVNPAEAQWSPGQLSSEINIIGADWKSYDMEAGQYVIQENSCYFVQDVDGNVWKLVFTGYGGAANGEMSFNQEMVSPTGVAAMEPQAVTVGLWPNPVSNGSVELVADLLDEDAVIRVINATGQQLLHRQWGKTNGPARHQLDVSALPAGLYWVRVENAKGASTLKMVVR